MQKIALDRRATRLGFAVLDAIILLAAGGAAAWIRFNPVLFKYEIEALIQHPGFAIYAVGVQLALGTTFDLYRPESWRSREVLLVRLAAIAITLPVALALGVYLVQPWRFGRGLLFITLLVALPAQGLIRLIWLSFASRPATKTALLIGDGPIVGALIDELERRPSPPFTIIRHFPSPKKASGKKPRSRDLAKADLVIVASLTHNPTVDQLAALNFRGTTVVDAAGAYAALTGRIPVLQVDSGWFIASGDFSSLASSPFHQVQRIADLVIASVMLLLSLPLVLLSGLAVLVTSGRPVFYTQERIGRYGKTFTLLKLRTMDRKADSNGPTFTEENDSRMVAPGGFMRRWRIDELPQLINVLRGEMSMVGPRPERPKVADRLEREIPFYAFRYGVRPGITGWAQVNLPYCSETEDHLVKLEFDLYSLRHYGPAMYFMVLLRTLGALIFRPGR